MLLLFFLSRESWVQRKLPRPFRKRISVVLESNYADYRQFYRAFKSLVMYAFVPNKIKNRSITPLFRNKIEQINKLCGKKESKLCNYLKNRNYASLKTSRKSEVYKKIYNNITLRALYIRKILNILSDLLKFGKY